MNRRKVCALGALCLAACLVATACSLGPRAMQVNRMDYNLSAQRSTHEQMLLNLVRTKYLENPLFMQVGTIASSFNYTLNAGATATTAPESYQFPLGAALSETPTVTFTPYDGQKYTQEILAELGGSRMLILFRSNVDLEILLRCVVDRIGRLENQAPNRPVDRETLAEFADFCKKAREMQVRRELEILSVVQKDKNQDKDKEPAQALVLLMRFSDEGQARSMANRLGTEYRPRPRQSGKFLLIYRLVDSTLMEAGPNQDPRFVDLPVRLRSCREVLDYLGQGVEVPPSHLAAGVSNLSPLSGDGRLVDPRPFVGDLFQVRQSPDRPADAFVEVRYRDAWFYIPDNDLRSKMVFSLMLTLMALQSSSGPAPTPVLTLSVGG